MDLYAAILMFYLNGSHSHTGIIYTVTWECRVKGNFRRPKQMRIGKYFCDDDNFLSISSDYLELRNRI